MSSKVEEYEKLLRALSLRVEQQDQGLIQRALEKVGIDPLLCSGGRG